MSLIIITFSISNGLISKAITIKPIIFLGEASFSFYMIHQIIFNYYLMNVKFSMNSVSDFIWSASIILFVSVIFSMAIYSFYEKPVNTMLRKIIKRSPSFWRPSV